jgi:hypothetical protein
MITPQERAEIIALPLLAYSPPESALKNFKKMVTASIEEAVKEREQEIVLKQALVLGESITLGGKIVTNEELYKQPVDYIREARAEAFEESASLAEEGVFEILCNAIEAEGVVRRTRNGIAQAIRRHAAELREGGK